jgi:hypothetical protein
MRRRVQGSILDEEGCPIDYEWERARRTIERDGLAEIPLLRSSAPRAPGNQEIREDPPKGKAT